jgi:hypothetical protein
MLPSFFYLKPTASEQKTSEERGAEDHLSVLTESSNRRLGLPRFEFNGDFILADKMARAAGNILREISVYNLSAEKFESEGALKENQ